MVKERLKKLSRERNRGRVTEIFGDTKVLIDAIEFIM